MMTTATVLTQLMRLHQITLWSFYERMMEPLKILKIIDLHELLDTLDEIHGKVVIWAHYQYDVETIVKHLKKEYGDNCFVTYYGKTPMSERQDNIKKFQDNRKSRKIFSRNHANWGVWYHPDGCEYNDLLL